MEPAQLKAWLLHHHIVQYRSDLDSYAVAFSFLSDRDSYAIEFANRSVELTIQTFSVIALLFGPVVVSHGVVRPIRCTNSPELQHRITSFVDRHKKVLPGVQRITAYLRKLKPNETFYVLPFGTPPASLVLELGALLATSSQRHSAEERQIITNFWGDFFDYYDLEVHGLTREVVGKPDKAHRVCRFCNNTRSPLSFRKRAHAISEALGNKTVTIRDECDGCNTWFGSELEPDLIELLSVFRTLHGVKGKGGRKSYTGKNYVLQHGGNGDNLSIVARGTTANTPTSGFTLQLQNAVSLQNAYKCLVKFFLSVVDEHHLPLFEDTIRWLNGSVQIDHLPRIAFGIWPHEVNEQPKLAVQICRISDSRLPLAVGELLFTAYKIVFIVPFAGNRNQRFITDEEYAQFWHLFPHYRSLQEVAFYDWSSPLKQEVEINFSTGLTEVKHRSAKEGFGN